jgi:hypothetical protein
MNNKKRCLHCLCSFYPAAHIKNQKYCAKKECQKARKNSWMRQKLKSDKDYRDNQKIYWNKWKIRNYGYWNRYKNKPKSTKYTKKYDLNKQQQQLKTTQAKITLKLLPNNKQAFGELVNNKVISCQLRLI